MSNILILNIFLKVKKVPNWVTSQIVEQCNWSGLIHENELDTITKTSYGKYTGTFCKYFCKSK